jgi:hypothetical protein
VKSLFKDVFGALSCSTLDMKLTQTHFKNSRTPRKITLDEGKVWTRWATLTEFRKPVSKGDGKTRAQAGWRGRTSEAENEEPLANL